MSSEPDELPDLTHLAIRAPRDLLTWLQSQGVTIEELRARDNHPVMVAARRAVARYLSRRGWSSVMIGRYLERDHSTVLYYLGRLKAQGGNR